MENDLLIGGYNNDSDAELNNNILDVLNDNLDEALETLLDDKYNYKTYQDCSNEINSALSNANDVCTLLSDVNLDSDLENAIMNLDDDIRNLPESKKDVDKDYSIIKSYVKDFNNINDLNTVFLDV